MGAKPFQDFALEVPDLFVEFDEFLFRNCPSPIIVADVPLGAAAIQVVRTGLGIRAKNFR